MEDNGKIETTLNPVEAEEVKEVEPKSEILEDTPAKEDTKEDKSNVPYKSFKTKDEWDNYENSLRAKHEAKTLESFKVQSSDELLKLITSKDNQLKELATGKDTAELNLKNLQADLKQTKEDNIVIKLDVSDDYKDDLLTLAKARVTEEKDLETISKEIMAKNPNWKKLVDKPKVGVENSHSTSKDNIGSKLSKKYGIKF